MTEWSSMDECSAAAALTVGIYFAAWFIAQCH
jgi:hypothetical protein